MRTHAYTYVNVGVSGNKSAGDDDGLKNGLFLCSPEKAAHYVAPIEITLMHLS